MIMTRHFFVCLALVLAGDVLATEAKVKLVETSLLPIAAKTVGVPANIDDRMRAYGVPGISIAVVDAGRIAWAKGYGVADSSSRRPVTTGTLFQAASISKPVSAMGALLLVQKGLVDLDGDVNAALKSWTIPANELTRASPVTLRMLLNHTSGAVHTGPIEIASLPGSSFSYSGTGYEILQQLIVDVSGKPFEEFMQAEVLRPLGMTSSTFAQPLPESLLPIAATGHYAGGKPMPGRFRIAPQLAAAGLWSTPTDIAKYLLNVQRSYAGTVDEPLKRSLTRQMLSPGLGSRGLGPAISGTGEFVRFGHDGFNEGFESSFVAYVNGGRGAVVMANSGFAFMLLKEILDSVQRVYEWPAYSATTQQPPAANMGQQLVVPISRRTLASTVGTYEVDGIATIRIYRQGNRLLLDWPGNGVAEVFATPDGRLFCPPLTFSEVGTPWLDEAQMVPVAEHASRHRRIL
jgi:CubicO group peptidase (beta-lactamase class C family)